VSLRCSHLGCRLRASGDEGLVCPCHGSLFDARGRPRRGPAREPLQALAFRIDREREALVVDLPS
jgi:Rieske Fe-S protein